MNVLFTNNIFKTVEDSINIPTNVKNLCVMRREGGGEEGGKGRGKGEEGEGRAVNQIVMYFNVLTWFKR